MFGLCMSSTEKRTSIGTCVTSLYENCLHSDLCTWKYLQNWGLGCEKGTNDDFLVL